jgi:TolB-like protein/DNA-binding winged helix-turn-helix (wHTH) protein/tetratricopeptide (TPR) repeat protein
LDFRFADFEIDLARQELRRAGALVHAEPQVFDLVVHLVRNRHRIVRKDELIEVVWQGRIVSEAALSSRISAARRALGDSGNDQSLIRTVHKRGFRFVGDVERAEPGAIVVSESQPHGAAAQPPPRVLDDAELVLTDPASDATALPCARLGEVERGDGAGGMAAAQVVRAPDFDRAAEAAADPMAPESGPSAIAATNGLGVARNLLFALLGAGLATVSAAAAGWLWSPASPSPSAQTEERFALAGEPSFAESRRKPQRPSIVVLPFANLSGDAKRDDLADGITDSLISDLAHALPGMSVVARETAFTYKGRAADARRIGRELNVRYLVEGSVVVDGERVRVNARLVETAGGSQLWADRFDIERTSILQVQDEIVSRVSRATGLQVVDLEARRSWRERPGSAEAADLILRGKAVLNLPSSPTTMSDARGLFEQALEVEPDSVDALAGVATTMVFEFLNGYYDTDPDDRLHQAELRLDRALTLEPRHLMALKAKAALRRAQGRFADAIIAAEAVVADNPGEPWAYKEIGLSTLYLGNPEQALDWFAKAERIGPRDPARWTWQDGRGHALILLGRDEDAVRALSGALDANPRNASSHAFLAAAYALLGRTEEARASLALYDRKHPGTRISSFRTRSPVPLGLTSASYQRLRARLTEGLRKAGMPE